MVEVGSHLSSPATDPRLKAVEPRSRDLSQDPRSGRCSADCGNSDVLWGPHQGGREEGRKQKKSPGKNSTKAVPKHAPRRLLGTMFMQAELVSWRTSPLWEPPGPTHAAMSSNKAWDPALSPASSHILTFSGVSLFAFCLRRSALMNAEVKGLRKNNNGDTRVIKETNG